MARTRLFWVAVSAGALIAAGPGGCASCGPYQRVGVESVPTGAEVFADGESVGTTPLEIRISTETEHAVFVKKKGYKPELVVMQRNVPPDDPPPFLTPADVRVRLTRLAPRLGSQDEGGPQDEDDPNSPLDPLGRDLEVDVEDD